MVKPGRIKLVYIMAIPEGHFLWSQSTQRTRTKVDLDGSCDLGSSLTNVGLAGEVNEIICQYD